MKALRNLSIFAILTSVFLLANPASAQSPVSWTLKSSKTSARAGEKFNVQVSASIGGGWHVYSITQGAGGPIPTRITVEGAPFSLAGGIKGSAPKRAMDPNFQIITETYDGAANFTLPIAVAADAAPGSQTLNVNVRFQTCNDQTCLPPKTVKLTASMEITGGTAVAANVNTQVSPSPTLSPTPKNDNSNVNSNLKTLANANTNSTANSNVSENAQSALPVDSGPSTPSATNPGNAKATSPAPNTPARGGFDPNSSLWSFILAAMLAGAASLLTPCVFPMIPITVSYFTNHAEGSRMKAVRNALIFAFGIISTFTVLGFLLAALFGAGGINKFAASPYVNIFIGGLFITFAFSLLGAYELGIPSSILTKFDSIARGKESSQFVGLLLMGLVFSMTSFTCTTPLVGGLLVLSTQGSWVYPIIGMLAFSSVFALPFFVLALAPQLVAQLPKSGGWLNSVKVVMGFLEIAAAMKFISNVDLVWGWGIFTREVVLATWVACSLLIVLYLLGVFQLTHDMKLERIGAVRLMISLIFLSLGFYLLTGLFGQTLGEIEAFLPPKAANSTQVSGNFSGAKSPEADWITNDFQAALTKAKAENKHVFIDFTGYTCTNCRWMEINMFPKTKVNLELEKYVRVRLYTDGEGEPFEGFQKMQEEKFNTVALPLYAIIDADQNHVAIFPGLTRDENEFVTFLQSGQTKLLTELVQK